MIKKLLAIIGVIIFLIILISPVLLNALRQGGLGKEVPKPEIVIHKPGKCVEDTDYMRANHMDMLKKEREKAVRCGKRNTAHSLVNCRTCHTNREEFCNRCHNYVGVKPECFECHYYSGGRGR
ncbi:MAG: sulfur reduction protein DsrJ [Nitrospirota bacterium]